MPKDEATGWFEPDIVINGETLTFAECLVVRVAVTAFRMRLDDLAFRQGVGEPLASNYDRHLQRVEQTMWRRHG